MNEQTQPNSIPVIRLWDNLLVALQGDLGDAQAERLRSELLDRIRRTGAEGLILDVSGVTVIDSHLCSVLASITEAAALMGVESMLCGLSPEIVMTLQAMGIEFGGVETALSLEDALEALGIGPLGVVADADASGQEASGVSQPLDDGGSA